MRQLAFLTEETHHANLIQLPSLSAEQTGGAMADPALAGAMSTLDNLSERQRRQVLFLNAQYSVIVLNHRLGVITLGRTHRAPARVVREPHLPGVLAADR